jgi:cytidylate kinase
MPVVAITREMGSLGKDVAKGLSEALGVPLYYHEVIDHLADRMRVRKSHVERLLDGSAGLFERLTADKTSLSIFSADEIVNLALKGRGCVIRGWGATHLLREVPHAVCVRVCAPFGVRKQRMMERVGSDDGDRVAEEIQQNDEAHTAIMRRNFSVQWTESEHYDLVLNTQRVSINECVDEVMALVKSPQFAEPEESRRGGFRRGCATCAPWSAPTAAASPWRAWSRPPSSAPRCARSPPGCPACGRSTTSCAPPRSCAPASTR